MMMINSAGALAPTSQERTAITLSDLSDKRIETGIVRSRKGFILLIWLTDIQTEETRPIPWDDLSPQVQEAVCWLANDPLKLLDRYAAALQPNHTHRPPVAPRYAA